MKVSFFILSMFFVSTICLGPAFAGGAQLLSDDDLDQVTAAGTSWNVEFFNPTNVGLGITPTTTAPANTALPNPALGAALSSVTAAAAAANTAGVLGGSAGAAMALDSVSTAAVALETASVAKGLESLNLGQANLTAAANFLNSVPLEQHTPEIIEAANKINQAAASLNQAALDNKAIELNSAVKAVEKAKNAIHGLAQTGVDVDFSQAIEAAVDSIETARGAIDAASQAQASSGGSQSAFVLKDDGGNLQPILRINFDSGRTVGSADIIPIVTRGAPGQPGLDLDGATFTSPNGILPLTLVAETLMMNMNICYFCKADKIIQNNNGYIVPIYVK